MSFTKVVRLGTTDAGNVFCKIEFNDKQLSISGVEGPKADGDCRGSCGQIQRGLTAEQFKTFAPDWDADKVTRFLALWERWHLNDMRAGCEHQRATWDTSEKIEVVSYKLTMDAYYLRQKTRTALADAALRGEVLNLDPTARTLAGLDKWFQSMFSPPDADSPLSGCYEVDKRETKAVGWVSPNEHPKGLLSKPCDVCGYKYGTAWLFEEVPTEVLDELRALPDTDVKPAWV